MSSVQIRIGNVEVSLEGSEEFIEKQLPEVLDRLPNLRRLAPLENLGEQSNGRDGAEPADSLNGSRAGDPVAAFAEEIDVSPDHVEAACAPSKSEPYIKLDRHFYSSFKQNTPDRGPSSVPHATLVATLLTFWFDKAELGNPTHPQLLETIKASDLKTSNAKRAVKNCEWLQYRGEEITITPIEVEQAIAVAKAYCTKKAISS